MLEAFKQLGIHIPSILFPKQEVNLEKWCVVACDQYTSQPEYWQGVEDFVGQDPSTLHLILPEVYLGRPEEGEKIKGILNKMKEYLEGGVLLPLNSSFVLVVRETGLGRKRHGLMVALDLEMYSYQEGSDSLIRATEATVVDRIPPRLKIREKANLELPHILVLIDDPEKTVIEPLVDLTDELDEIYDAQLMMEAGSIKGYAVNKKAHLERICKALMRLKEPGVFEEKYGNKPEGSPFLYAVGDGNHSLATAKAHWEKIKGTLPVREQEGHPARFALVELNNVYDEGLYFEPIHRVLFNTDPQKLLEKMVKYYENCKCEVAYHLLDEQARDGGSGIGIIPNEDTHVLPFIFQDKAGVIIVKHPKHPLAAGTLQSCLDYLGQKLKDMKIDYVHGADVVEELAQRPGNIGFILPPMDKHDLFKTVVQEGVLPQKTFSLGEADEKRFYMESRKIVRG